MAVGSFRSTHGNVEQDPCHGQVDDHVGLTIAEKGPRINAGIGH